MWYFLIHRVGSPSSTTLLLPGWWGGGLHVVHLGTEMDQALRSCVKTWREITRWDIRVRMMTCIIFQILEIIFMKLTIVFFLSGLLAHLFSSRWFFSLRFADQHLSHGSQTAVNIMCETIHCFTRGSRTLLEKPGSEENIVRLKKNYFNTLKYKLSFNLYLIKSTNPNQAASSSKNLSHYACERKHRNVVRLFIVLNLLPFSFAVKHVARGAGPVLPGSRRHLEHRNFKKSELVSQWLPLKSSQVK